MSKHTPGPWFYEGADNGGRVLAKDERHTIIHAPPCSPFNQHAISDARLIAAAPDLLEVAEELTALVVRIRASQDWGAIEEHYYKARAAIAKAKGEA
jgi:hypothetical protein